MFMIYYLLIGLICVIGLVGILFLVKAFQNSDIRVKKNQYKVIKNSKIFRFHNDYYADYSIYNLADTIT